MIFMSMMVTLSSLFSVWIFIIIATTILKTIVLLMILSDTRQLVAKHFVYVGGVGRGI